MCFQFLNFFVTTENKAKHVQNSKNFYEIYGFHFYDGYIVKKKENNDVKYVD